MKPLGRKPLKFPGKVDSHPHKHSERNWWEDIRDHKNDKKSERRKSKMGLSQIR